ncbi:MAG: hypothetical protein ACJ8AO_10825 [Gemmatimonadaceae bacterium]
MSASRRARLGAAVAFVAVAGLGGTPAAAGPAQTDAARITAAGVGQVRLGATFRSVRADGAVGGLRRGCELAGPDARTARLRAPLRGSVTLSADSPRRVTDIQVSGGARARGVGVGSTAAAIRRAFPRARFDHSTDDVFGVTIAKVPRGGGGRIQFAVDVATRKVTTIGVPALAFCE